jgi:hypothetical protein
MATINDLYELTSKADVSGINAGIDAVQRSDRAVSDLGNTSDKTSGKLSRIGDTLGGLGQKATVGVTLPLVALAGVAVKTASDLGETTSKIDVIFGDASTSIKDFANSAATSLGQSKQQALDAAATFATFGKAAGLAGDDLVEFSKQNVQLATDLASFNNTSPEEALQAISGAMRGEAEAIRRYGVMIDDASLKNAALRLGLIKTTNEALLPQQRVLAVQAVILQQTSAAQGDFARTSGALAGQTKIAKAEMEDALAMLGQNLIPLVTEGAHVVNSLITAFNGLTKEQQNLIIALGALAAAAGPVLSIAGKAFTVIDALRPALSGVAGGLGGLIGSLKDSVEYLHGAGVSAGTLKDVFVELKGSGAILTGELALLAAGLLVIVTYLGRVGEAAQASSDKLIEMSRSGDLFDQAAASTEILVHGQERIREALDAVNEKLKQSADGYADYRSSIEATARAAGYALDEHGNLIDVYNTLEGQRTRIIQANYALTASDYAANKALHEKGGLLDQTVKGLITLGAKSNEYKATQDRLTAATATSAGGLKEYYEATRNAAIEGVARGNDLALQSIEVLKTAMGGAVTKEMDDFAAKQDALRGKADELQKTISTSYGKARTDAIASLGDINKELDANATAHEQATARILFDIAAQQLATVQDPQIRAAAMNQLALQWGLVDQATYDATTKIIGYTADLAKDSNLDQFTGRLNGLYTSLLNPPPTPVVIPVKVDFAPTSLQGVAGDSMKERLAQFKGYQVDLKAKLDTTEAAAHFDDLSRRRTDLQKPIQTTVTASTTAAVTDLTRVADQQKLIAPVVSSTVTIDNSQALNAIQQVMNRWQTFVQALHDTPAPRAPEGSPAAPGALPASATRQMRARGLAV